MTVSITFRLSALSAQVGIACKSKNCRICLNYLSAQCPFGTVVRGASALARRRRLNYLSAQCPFGTFTMTFPVVGIAIEVSITFRLSALSAPDASVSGPAKSPSICLNYLSAQCPFGTTITLEDDVRARSLNYLSAQCPFGTTQTAATDNMPRAWVSITFRLSALSAR